MSLMASTETSEFERSVAAHHEAGHAVAATMRGGSTLTSVSLSPEHGAGITSFNAKAADGPFITYAGLWAQARYLWGDRPQDGVDDEGCEFQDYVAGAFLNQPEDAEALAVWWRTAEMAEMERAMPGVNARTEECWQHELEQVWPAVAQVAHLLLDGHKVDDATVRELVESERGRRA